MISTSQLFENYNINLLNHIDLLKKYNIPKSESIIIGSGLLRVYNLIPQNRDLDIVVSEKVYNKLKNNSDFYKNKVGMMSTKDDKFEFDKKLDVLNMSFNEIKNHTIKINGYLFMNPKLTLKFYQTLNRLKDQEKIKLIKQYLL